MASVVRTIKRAMMFSEMNAKQKKLRRESLRKSASRKGDKTKCK